jgi:hypothetical protein
MSIIHRRWSGLDDWRYDRRILIDATGGCAALGSVYGVMVLLGSLVIYFLVTEAVSGALLHRWIRMSCPRFDTWPGDGTV